MDWFLYDNGFRPERVNNFINILKQLDQIAMPLFCDEGVYRIVVDIPKMSRKVDSIHGHLPYGKMSAALYRKICEGKWNRRCFY